MSQTQRQRGLRRKKKKRSLMDAIIALVLLVGVGLLLYPTVSNKWNEMHQTKAIADYTHAVENLQETDYEAILAEAAAYNEALKSNPDRFSPTEEEDAYYNTLLNVQGNGVMGYIEIPSIKVKMPIYHGTDEAVLQVAAGHLEGTSLPIGGLGTHSAISGHRGLTSATLFTHLDKLKEGDEFFVYVLNETMRYRVTEINTVLPDEVDLLVLDDERDLCTLITCTPYGVNSHRLLVQGERVDLDENTAGEDSSSNASSGAAEDSGKEGLGALQIIVFALLMLVVFVIVCAFASNRSKSNDQPDINE